MFTNKRTGMAVLSGGAGLGPVVNPADPIRVTPHSTDLNTRSIEANTRACFSYLASVFRQHAVD